MDPSLLADHLAQTVRKHFPKSSAIELEDQYLPTKAFRDTTNFDKPHIAANLPTYLETYTKNGKDDLTVCKEEARPHTLVIASSGIRTADLARELRSFGSEKCQVAKLVTKHMKLKDNIEYMKKTKVGIAISTPMRFRDLVEEKAMKTEGIKRIVIDGSYKDEKQRTIFHMAELFNPLISFLNREDIRTRYGTDVDDPVEILVF
jgi:protein CMS1